MATKRKGPAMQPNEVKTTRASVSFPSQLYEVLQRIAEEKKVSVAWIVRDATEKYVNDQWPLFKEETM